MRSRESSARSERVSRATAQHSPLWSNKWVELRERLMHQREEVAARENCLAEKRAQLAEAERLEALQRYEEKVGALSEAGEGVRRAAGELLAAPTPTMKR
jgi:hypothetical protein